MGFFRLKIFHLYSNYVHNYSLHEYLMCKLKSSFLLMYRHIYFGNPIQMKIKRDCSYKARSLKKPNGIIQLQKPIKDLCSNTIPSLGWQILLLTFRIHWPKRQEQQHQQHLGVTCGWILFLYLGQRTLSAFLLEILWCVRAYVSVCVCATKVCRIQLKTTKNVKDSANEWGI